MRNRFWINIRADISTINCDCRRAHESSLVSKMLFQGTESGVEDY